MPDGSYNIYRRQRRRRWPYVAIAAVCVLAAVAAWQLIGVPRVSAVTPGPDAYVKDPSLKVVLDVKGLAKLDDVKVVFDGADITARTSRDGDRLTFRATDLDDGPHNVAFSGSSSNLFRREVQKNWRFTVDTSIPTLKLDGEADEGRINSSPATFSGETEPFATVTVADGALKASGTADASGEYSVSVKLPDGPSDITITTRDRAGNATTQDLHVYVDAEPPVLKTTQLKKTMSHSGITVRIKVTDQLGTPKVKLLLDGTQRKIPPPVSKTRFKAGGLAQGRHKLIVTATDKGGNVVTDQQVFVVDSTERFGSATLWPGARGKDVKQLQKKLADLGFYSGKKTSVYDTDTKKAVTDMQESYGLEVDGLVGDNTLTALSGKIVIDIGSLTLYLYRGDRLIKSYPVAAGQPAYPTPTGSYHIVNMQKDPTWLPPNSDWAKDAEPIPPGTENPLGTRWMGTSAPGVGIHGVPPSEDGSIGTYASHGCIRMHNWDAIDLFDRIVVGMPVFIQS